MNILFASSAKVFWTRLFVLTTAVSLVFGSASFINSADATSVLFSDGFESGDFSAWDSASDEWSVEAPGGADSSENYAQVAGLSDEENVEQSLVANFSSEGFEDLRISFYYQMQEMDSGDSIYLEWSSDADSWSEITSFFGANGDDNSSDWVFVDEELASGTDDLEELFIRFRSSMNTGTDTFLLDQVNVYGEEIYDGLLFDVFGTKYEDTIGLGSVDDFGEGLASWGINLYGYDAENELVVEDATVTDKDGDYEFGDLQEGDYLLCENKTRDSELGWVQTWPGEDDRDQVSVVENSSPNSSSEAPMCYALSLTEDDSELSESGLSDLHFANHGRECLIEGFKFDVDENPLEGWTIGLSGYVYLGEDLGEDVELTALTDADGYYCIEPSEELSELDGEDYYVFEEIQPGWVPYEALVDDYAEEFYVDFEGETPRAEVEVELEGFTVEKNPLRVDFYNEHLPCIVDGYKYDGEGTGLEGWRVGLEGLVYEELEGEEEGSEYFVGIGDDVTDEDGYYCVENEYFFLGEYGESYESFRISEELASGWNPNRIVADLESELDSYAYSGEGGKIYVASNFEGLGGRIDFYNDFQGCLVEGRKLNEESEPLGGVDIGLLGEIRSENSTQVDPPTLGDGPNGSEFIVDSFFDISYEILGTDTSDESGRYCIVDENRLLPQNRVELVNEVETELVQLSLTGRGIVAEAMPEGYDLFGVAKDGDLGAESFDSFFDIPFEIDSPTPSTENFDSFFDVFVELEFDNTNRFPDVDFYNKLESTDSNGGGGGSSGGGGGGGSSSGSRSGSTPGGSVLGASIGPSCSPWLSSFIGDGVGVDWTEILRLQLFLNLIEGENLDLNGVYDSATADAVGRFQLKYRSEILGPWGLAVPTRLVWITTTNKINSLVESGCELPLPDGDLKRFPPVFPEPLTPGQIFSDGFESGDTSSWSTN